MPDYPIPSDLAGNWTLGTNCGVDGGIEQYRPGGASARTIEIDVTAAPYNADNTGATSARTAIQAAITAATSGRVVKLPAGRYLIDGPVTVPNGKNDITIRGDGAATVCYFSGLGVFNIYGSASAYGSGAQTLTGTRTQGTSVLTVASTSAYGVGELATVIAENEEDNTRIQAGAAPTWSQYGYRRVRRMCVRIAAKTATTLTIEPPLPWDLTNVGGSIERGGSFRVERVGFEDFNCEFNTASHPLAAIDVSLAINCWVYNVNVPLWQKTGSNGSMVIFDNSHKFQVQHCDGIMSTTALVSSDGFLQPSYASAWAVIDCAFINWDVGLYSSGRTYHGVAAFNFALTSQTGSQSSFNLSHGGQDALTLCEGNVVGNVGIDGYHGGASNMVMFRNWLHGTNAAQTLRGYMAAYRRFTRRLLHLGNVFGKDGWNAPILSLGNPNIGNANNNGDTSNTGTGDFWADWKLTGTLTTRTSDSAGVVTASGGEWASTSGGSARVVGLYWNGFASSRLIMTISARTGNVLTLTGGSGSVLPPEGTVFDMVIPNTSGFQELDDAVAATLTSVHNYEASQTATGSVVNPLDGGTTMPESLCYPAGRPAWWPTSLTWPAVNPDSPTFDYEALPAGYRYFNGVDAPSGALTVPVITVDPATATYSAGANVTLVANATGNPTPEWSWTKNGSPVVGATTRFLSLPAIAVGDAGTYVATATNSQGSDVSASAVITVSAVADTTPPTPNPSTIASATVNSSTQITVVATTATDAVSSPVEYNHAIDGTFLGWQSSATRIITGLTPSTLYSLRVKARDALGNETTQSAALERTTDAITVTGSPSPLGHRGTRAGFGVF